MRAKIYVSLKTAVLDPQGDAVNEIIKSNNIVGIENIRQGKYFEIKLSTSDADEATKIIDKICNDYIANQVIENYEFELIA